MSCPSPSPASLSEPDGVALAAHATPLASSLSLFTASRLHRYIERAAFLGMAAGSVFLALVSYRYLAPQARATLPPTVLANFFARPFLYVHAAAAATALLVGPFQFVASLRRSHLRLHRMLGRLYVLSCLVGGASALPLSLASTAGSIARSGFFALGVAWLVATGNGWQSAVGGRIAEHRRWMVRSFALTFSAVTFRLIIVGLPLLFGVPFVVAYGVGTWTCWVPNLLLVEAWMSCHSTAVLPADAEGSPQSELKSTSDDAAESMLACKKEL